MNTDVANLPRWLHTLAGAEPFPATGAAPNPVIGRPAEPGARAASVLVLFGGSAQAPTGGLPTDADVLLTQRAATLRQHRGQVAFPGGGSDATDPSVVATALREAEEETGLDPRGVDVVKVWPRIYVPPSRFDVTPVLGYWRTPTPVGVVDQAEAARVMRVPLDELLDPANRFVVRHPLGYMGPAFTVQGVLVWGFTAGVLAAVLGAAGWERPWDTEDVRDLETSLARAGMLDTLITAPKPESAPGRGVMS